MSEYFDLLFNGKLDEAEKIRKSSIPPKLIKFFSLNNSSKLVDKELNENKFNTLAKQELWFSRAENMNDPYEFQCMYINKDKFLENGHSEEDIANYNKILVQQKSQWALASLSGNTFDCLPMWAYYTNNYQGYCVEYDILKPDAIFKIGYEPDRIPIAALIANLFHAFYAMKENRASETSDDMEFYLTLFNKQFFLKHESWKHENEYRIIYPIISGYGRNVNIAKVGLKTSKIVAGLNCSDEHKKRLNEISNALGCGDIAVSKISGEKYTLLEDMDNG